MADGMVTDEPGVLLAVQAADCVPVIVADTREASVRGVSCGVARDGGGDRAGGD